MNLKKLTNEELCIRAQSGEHWIAAEMLRLNDGLFRKIANSVMFDFSGSGIKGIDGDDLHQMAWLKAHELIYKYDPNKNVKFSTFVYQPIRNELIDFVRAESGRNFPTQSQRQTSDWDEYIAGSYVKSPEVLYIQKETEEELHAALDALPLRNSRYLEYRFGFDDYEEHSKKDAARYFHLSLNRGEKLEKISLSMMREKLI